MCVYTMLSCGRHAAFILYCVARLLLQFEHKRLPRDVGLISNTELYFFSHVTVIFTSHWAQLKITDTFFIFL